MTWKTNLFNTMSKKNTNIGEAENLKQSRQTKFRNNEPNRKSTKYVKQRN